MIQEKPLWDWEQQEGNELYVIYADQTTNYCDSYRLSWGELSTSLSPLPVLKR